MGIEFFTVAVGFLLFFAVMDLIVGVSNDAVNFLNSSFGSRVAPRAVIMGIASVGILAGVSFSSGMMEIARKGIFVPEFFTMPELITIFIAVMITDILLLDLFNTFGLPTSTTVSIVFELLGAAVAISVVKLINAGEPFALLGKYINTGKALTIISGILLSIVVAFICGAVFQFLSRMLFTFNYMDKINRYGAIWGGVALSFIIYFILVKGAKGAVFLTAEQVLWINTHTGTIMGWSFIVSALILQCLLFMKINVFKPIILIGTFALAMAFAANDLVNFIGVPLAGLHAYNTAIASTNPLTIPMGALGSKVQSDGFLLLIAGAIMIVTLWVSRKARTVSATELSLGQQEEGLEKYDSNFLARRLVRMSMMFFDFLRFLIPGALRKKIAGRFDTTLYQANTDSDNRPSFDLLRASVNLMVASMIISYATSYKLPLSTTYITFMVSMGTSFSDRAWGRDSAVYRVSGVMTVIGGWFMTAFLAFMICCSFALCIHYFKIPGTVFVLVLATLIYWKNHTWHSSRVADAVEDKVFNLKKVTDVHDTITTTYKHMGYLNREMRKSLGNTLTALFDLNSYALSKERKRTRKIQHWTNIIIANIYKSLRLLQRDSASIKYRYPAITRQLQKLADGHRDIVTRAYKHVDNNHSGLLQPQIEELHQVFTLVDEILEEVETVMGGQKELDTNRLKNHNQSIRKLGDDLNSRQIQRIEDGESKTRLSILYYALIGNGMMICKQNLKLLRIFEESFTDLPVTPDEDFE